MADHRKAASRSSPRPPPAAVTAWRWMSVLQARMIDQLESDALAAEVVPFSWFEVLAALEAAPQNRVRAKDLVDAVLMTRAGVSRLLDRIESAGFLRRESSTGDGRGMDAVLTPAGMTALSQARPVYLKIITHHFGRNVTAAQLETLTSLCRQILAANDWLPDIRPVSVTISKRQAPG